MIRFHTIQIQERDAYEEILFSQPERNCEYSFANQFLWGRQEHAYLHGCIAYFAHFYGRSVYPYPIGSGDKRRVVAEIMEDALQRGIPCRFSSLTQTDREELESWFPGRFRFQPDRNGMDYVYSIDDLADLRGRKYQKKRNHVNRFRAEHPDYQVVPLSGENMEEARNMVHRWFETRMAEDPDGDYLLEQVAMERAFRCFDALNMEGISLVDKGEVLAVTMGTRLSAETFDVHFEKALESVDGAYAAVNCEFARYLRLKIPELCFLNREDDMGQEGLRKAKLSYLPHHMAEKYWAYQLEDIDGR